MQIYQTFLLKIQLDFDFATMAGNAHLSLGIGLDSIHRKVLQEDRRVSQALPFIWSCAYTCCFFFG